MFEKLKLRKRKADGNGEGIFYKSGKAQETDKAEAQVESETSQRENEGLGGLLQSARFPITTKRQMVSALGGEGKQFDIDGKKTLTASQIAELCFTEYGKFSDSEQVLEAIHRSSWNKAVLSKMNHVPFPLKRPGVLSNRAGEIPIEGVKIRNLAGKLDYPIESLPQLLEMLAAARNS